LGPTHCCSHVNRVAQLLLLLLLLLLLRWPK
jgi:hypothetical protein